MRAALRLVIGGLVATGLMVLAVELWVRNLIVFGAPLGVGSLAALWVTFDNHRIYAARAAGEQEGSPDR